ncbi:MAG: transporter [Nevskiaceae bacterium]|nr:MAG: transporter [Nevskiaceae bacterium]TBR73053.1 MAG: transporter [Nevskiaceae bacterium]
MLTLSPVLSGLIGGVLFGVALEGAGFGSPCKLVGQLQFRDWTVFNVMFTAILVASVGLYFLELAGLIALSQLWIPTVFFWATLLGGAFVGLGMGVGGYCPGTCVVGFSSGHLDGIVFFVGLILGPIIFAGLYDVLMPMLTAAQGPTAQTLPELLHIPAWLILIAMVGMLIGVGVVTRRTRHSDATVQAAGQDNGGKAAAAGTAVSAGPAPSPVSGSVMQARVASRAADTTHTHF